MAVRKQLRTIVGVDGCPGGWVAVSDAGRGNVSAGVYPTFADLVDAFKPPAAIGVDIPIGLPDQGPRQCELDARQLLGKPRSASVFPAPLRACLAAKNYKDAGRMRSRIEGKKMSLQAFGIVGKIREVDLVLSDRRDLDVRVIEVHPEVSFALWNGRRAMAHGKKTVAGRKQRGALIESEWPGAIERLRPGLRGKRCALDDLHDAFAALWSMRRWQAGRAEVFGDTAARDALGQPMRIVG